MKISFHIPYKTVWGEQLYVIIENASVSPLPLTAVDGYNWSGTHELPLTLRNKQLCYHYAVYVKDVCTRRELVIGDLSHQLYLGEEVHHMVYDVWRDLPKCFYKYSSAFSPFIAGKKYIGQRKAKKRVVFRALCPELSGRNYALGICGSGALLGNWEHDAPLMMTETRPNVWQLSVDADALENSTYYKFVVVDKATGMLRYWEEHTDRHIGKPALLEGEVFTLPEVEVSFAEILPVRVAGSAIPVFSLRTEGSCGVGDFGDFYQYVLWVSQTSQRIVQILPINDTTMNGTWKDSYPYAAISVFALHPMYVDIRQLPVPKDKNFLSSYRKKRKQLNALPTVDYEAVNQLKRTYLKKVYEAYGEATFAEKAYEKFFAENKDWLVPYAVFCFLREKYGSPYTKDWKEYALYSKKKVLALAQIDAPSFKDVAFHFFVQYHLHLQLLRVAMLAQKKFITLKGDIAIGVNRNGVEVWTDPTYFYTDVQVGAPPDAFSIEGQNWGFPSYNWEAMEKDDYKWWKRRLTQMATYFSAYRIDHILGFFRIWENPSSAVNGMLGQFSPALPFTEEEIRSYGLFFDKSFMTQPFINEELLSRTFKERTEDVKKHFLEHSHYDVYRLQPVWNSQKELMAYLDAHFPGDTALREGLMILITNVLFIEDKVHKGTYHPRVMAPHTHIFTRLTDSEREAYLRLYHTYFYERHNEFWYREGMKKLPVIIQSTRMLACGEDLGMVPLCVDSVMKELDILTLEIERMPKSAGVEFAEVKDYPYCSVCTTGTHDMDTFRAWWEEDEERTERYYHQMLYAWGNPPQKATAKMITEVIRKHLHSASMLCVLPWQDWVGMNELLRAKDPVAERINIPANPHHYWRWRMHLTIEELMACDTLNAQISKMIADAGRSVE